jgi:hypothetical protein
MDNPFQVVYRNPMMHPVAAILCPSLNQEPGMKKFSAYDRL